MSIYHLSTKPIKRSDGRSSVAAAAYRAGEKLVDDRQGLTHNYERKGKNGVLAKDCFAFDENNNKISLDRSELWNKAEAAEKRKDARTARDFTIALPSELTLEQNKAALVEFAESLAREYGTAVDWAIHAPDKNGDNRNIHAHLMMTTRDVTLSNNQITLNKKTALELSNKDLVKQFPSAKKTQDQITDIRERWANIANKHLELANINERIDHRSYKQRGIEQLPTIKMGYVATQMERQGIKSWRGDINRERVAINAQINQIKIDIKQLNKLADAEQAARAQKHSNSSANSDSDNTTTAPAQKQNVNWLNDFTRLFSEKLAQLLQNHLDNLKNVAIEKRINYNNAFNDRNTKIQQRRPLQAQAAQAERDFNEAAQRGITKEMYNNALDALLKQYANFKDIIDNATKDEIIKLQSIFRKCIDEINENALKRALDVNISALAAQAAPVRQRQPRQQEQAQSQSEAAPARQQQAQSQSEAAPRQPVQPRDLDQKRQMLNSYQMSIESRAQALYRNDVIRLTQLKSQQASAYHEIKNSKPILFGKDKWQQRLDDAHDAYQQTAQQLKIAESQGVTYEHRRRARDKMIAENASHVARIDSIARELSTYDKALQQFKRDNPEQAAKLAEQQLAEQQQQTQHKTRRGFER